MRTGGRKEDKSGRGRKDLKRNTKKGQRRNEN